MPTFTHLTLKIYKISILIYKDCDQYIMGEHCFCHEYSRRNPQKMVWLWTEKEMRNLKQLVSAGIHCPEPVKARFHWWIFYPSMIGYHHTWKILKLPHPHILYQELILNACKMFHQCKLIHTNLSEYNILYLEDHLFIIGISQSVEQDHPNAFDFLGKDLKSIKELFGRDVRLQLFQFINCLKWFIMVYVYVYLQVTL